MFENEQSEAIDQILNSLEELDELLYSEEIAAIDRERASVFWSFYSAELDDCRNEEEKKACLEIIDACLSLQAKPCAKNARILDEKIEALNTMRGQ